MIAFGLMWVCLIHLQNTKNGCNTAMKQLYRILFIAFAKCFLAIPCQAQVIDEAQFNISQFAPKQNVEMDQAPGALVSIANISLNGFKKTKTYIIEREIPFKTGEYLLFTDLEKQMELARQQLMNTTLFVDVEVKVIDRKADSVFINVYVKERWYLFPLPYFKIVDRNFNEWWVKNNRSFSRVNYGLKYMQNNVSGRNDNLNIWLITGYTQQVSLRYENPFLDKTLRHGMNVGVSYSTNRELNYHTDNEGTQLFLNEPKHYATGKNYILKQYHADMAYTYRPAIKTRHNFRVSYNQYHISDSVLKFNPDFFPNRSTKLSYYDLAYTIQYFNVDYIPYPLSGFKGEASLYKRFGKLNNLWQLSANGTYNKKIFSKSYLEFQFSGVIKAPFDQPYFTTRIFGSSNMYMRGLEYYVIDGVAGVLGRVTAKKEVLSISIRNPIPLKTLEKIPFRFFVKAFTDAGYAHSPREASRLNNRWLQTVGAGIDILSIYDLVLKVEYSFNQFGQSGLFFHTSTDF